MHDRHWKKHRVLAAVAEIEAEPPPLYRRRAPSKQHIAGVAGLEFIADPIKHGDIYHAPAPAK
jgi:hypothetical protein